LQFSEKLNFLMDITNTTNSALALNSKLDASYISRLRSGHRKVSRHQTYVKTMAEYFGKRCVENYQRKALLEMMNLTSFPADNDNISKIIYNWMILEQSKEAKVIETFLIGFSNTKVSIDLRKERIVNDTLEESLQKEKSIYYGFEGKRQAVICFLSEVIKCKEPQTLLLFSDESTDWMTEDRKFAVTWAFLMSQVLSKGNRIKIIHTVSRYLDEMLNAISQWMPLYMSGLIEPYFYPKKRDGIFKKTMFISPSVSAVISSSIGNMSDKACNLLFWDKPAIKAFEEEFNQYLSMCKPLMKIFTLENEMHYLDTLIEFEKEKSDSIIKTESLSFITMPESVSTSILSRLGRSSENYKAYRKARLKQFENNLMTNSFVEIIQLPDKDMIINSRVKVALSIVLGGGTVYYTAKEYILHLEYIIHLLNTYKNFHVFLSTDIMDESYMVYVREEFGAIVAKTSAPQVALSINENNMTAAFWDFLKSIIGERNQLNMNNNITAKKLKDYLQQLKQNI